MTVLGQRRADLQRLHRGRGALVAWVPRRNVDRPKEGQGMIPHDHTTAAANGGGEQQLCHGPGTRP